MFVCPLEIFLRTAISLRTCIVEAGELAGMLCRRCGIDDRDSRSTRARTSRAGRWGASTTYHVLPPLHELLVDDLACEVLSSLDVDRLLDDGVRSTAQRLACPILCVVRAVYQSLAGAMRAREF